MVAGPLDAFGVPRADERLQSIRELPTIGSLDGCVFIAEEDLRSSAYA